MTQSDWKKVAVKSSDSILKTLEIIGKGGLQIALVVDEKDHLLGTVTDGDVRRGILKGISLQESVEKIMNREPLVATPRESRVSMHRKLQEKKLHQIPILNPQRQVVAIETINELLPASRLKENWVVLMAGGLGSRLGNLTRTTPKPLLEVGDRPILEGILNRFLEFGFQKFFISVNYLGEKIEAHFGDGSKLGAQIEYLREKEKLGTAGALGLLPSKPTAPIIVMNADLLTNVNFDQLLHYHHEHDSLATLCVQEYRFEVPFGVISVEEERISVIDEKPTQKFLINAGIYVLEPEALEIVPTGKAMDMTSLYEALIAKKKKVCAFPIREYWIDIGRATDLERANREFEKFGNGK